MSFQHFESVWYHQGTYHGLPAIYCDHQDCNYMRIIFLDMPLTSQRIPTTCPDCARRHYQQQQQAEPQPKTLKMWGESS